MYIFKTIPIKLYLVLKKYKLYLDVVRYGLYIPNKIKVIKTFYKCYNDKYQKCSIK